MDEYKINLILDLDAKKLESTIETLTSIVFQKPHIDEKANFCFTFILSYFVGIVEDSEDVGINKAVMMNARIALAKKVERKNNGTNKKTN